MTIQELLSRLQKAIANGEYSPDDLVFYDLWTYDDVAIQLENDHDIICARRVWQKVVSELGTYDEYPDHETIRDIIQEHIGKDLEANK